jgi:hypothetical protein
MADVIRIAVFSLFHTYEKFVSGKSATSTFMVNLIHVAA